MLDLDSPYARAVTVTPSDSTVLASTRAIYVGGAGAVAVTMLDGTNVVFAAVPVGTVLRVRVTKILSTGTTATNLLALS